MRPSLKRKNPFLRLAKRTVFFIINMLEIPEKDYKINPKVIPRPNHFDEIYKNADKEPYYETSEENHPPNAATYFITRETQNSSCRFIRSSLTKIPIDQSVLNSSQLMFGLYLQPFAEQHESETPIPVVESK